jgi:hypothetical protein
MPSENPNAGVVFGTDIALKYQAYGISCPCNNLLLGFKLWKQFILGMISNTPTNVSVNVGVAPGNILTDGSRSLQ